ncbi:hypothetical protein [Erythrobacter phage vB_EliS-L02]|nr:hypothetical protein [Erythrobacter phage vB_EliS-L02]
MKSKTLADEPVLGRHLYWIWQAFVELNMRRPAVGMGDATYIPFSEIEAYCRLKQIFLPSERERLVRMIDRLDREWMRRHLAEREKEREKSSGSKSPPPPTHSPPRHRPHRSQTRQVS